MKTVKKWTSAEDKHFIRLIKNNRCMTEIAQEFPSCTIRQIEHHMNNLLEETGLPRPTRMKMRNVTPKTPEERVDFSRFDFTMDNVQANDRHGQYFDVRLGLNL